MTTEKIIYELRRDHNRTELVDQLGFIVDPDEMIDIAIEMIKTAYIYQVGIRKCNSSHRKLLIAEGYLNA